MNGIDSHYCTLQTMDTIRRAVGDGLGIDVRAWVS